MKTRNNLYIHIVGLLVIGVLVFVGLRRSGGWVSKYEAYKQYVFSNKRVTYADYILADAMARGIGHSTKTVAIPIKQYVGDTSALRGMYANKKCTSFFCLRSVDMIALKGAVEDIKYRNKYSDPTAITGTILTISEKVAYGEGLVVPPYIDMLRDLLAEYDVFYVHKHDGNTLLGGTKIATVMLARLDDLLGRQYDSMFPLTSSLLAWDMREKYRALKSSDFMKLKSKYPHYNYVLVENDQRLDFPIVFTNSYFTLYQIAVKARL